MVGDTCSQVGSSRAKRLKLSGLSSSPPWCLKAVVRYKRKRGAFLVWSNLAAQEGTSSSEEQLGRIKLEPTSCQQTYEVQVVHSISEVDQEEWNMAATASGEVNPFVLHQFLDALEESKSAVKETGWLPHHIVVRQQGRKQIAGCCPLYLKECFGTAPQLWRVHFRSQLGGCCKPARPKILLQHSALPAWPRRLRLWSPRALALAQADVRKLQAGLRAGAAQVGGPRLMVADSTNKAAVLAALAKALIAITDEYGISSTHISFNGEEEWKELSGLGFLQRTGIQYHWENAGYASFQDFLAALKQPKRKNIRQERKAVAGAGLAVRRLSGGEVSAGQWDRFYDFYRNTTDAKWGSAYLTREFFQRLGAGLADHVLLVVAQEAGSPSAPLQAAALNLAGSQALFGRNWGAAHDCRLKHLHFELCYYQAQEEAIARGLQRVEAGAQGEHKIQRGYLPSKTYSSHYIRDPVLRSVIERHLQQERVNVDYNLQLLNQIASPYKAK